MLAGYVIVGVKWCPFARFLLFPGTVLGGEGANESEGRD